MGRLALRASWPEASTAPLTGRAVEAGRQELAAELAVERGWRMPVTVAAALGPEETLRLPPTAGRRAAVAAEEEICQFPAAWAKGLGAVVDEGRMPEPQPVRRPAMRPARPSEVTARRRRLVREGQWALGGRRAEVEAGRGIGRSSFRECETLREG